MKKQWVGVVIKVGRKKHGISQQTLADLTGVATNTVEAIERGSGNPKQSTLLSILDTRGLQVNIDLKQLDNEKM